MAIDVFNAEMLNQGYSLATDSGWCGTNLSMGPAEREEMFRCEMIDVICSERSKREKRGDDDEDWS